MTDQSIPVADSLVRLATYAARIGSLPYAEGRAFAELSRQFTEADTEATIKAAQSTIVLERVGVLSLTMIAVLTRLGELERRMVEVEK